MEIKTFDTILTELCDYFDELIAPRKISRANTNIIYLIFKAVAKGLEVINNVCVVLSNKFDPASCSVKDLDSVAKIVGTERYKGSASGLQITVVNEGTEDTVLAIGEYSYALNDDVHFVFEVLENLELTVGTSASFIAMSENIGIYPVTAQSEIEVTSDRTIYSGLRFSCTDNSALLGTEKETDLAFRKRILDGYDNQDSMVELENQLKNLPYLFDCKVKFNNLITSVVVDGITVPPFNAIIFFSGSPRSEIASLIANKIICPTVQTADSIEVKYHSSALVNDECSFYITPFKTEEFAVDIIIKFDELYISDYDVKKAIKEKLVAYFTPQVHKDYITEDDVYNVLSTLDLASLEVLGVNLSQGGEPVDFVSVPISKIPKLPAENITFTREVD